ncbi:Uncharacterised protein [Actinobacillus equuli]|nr:Uncharacterised protein [Actinobacillus equuli]
MQPIIGMRFILNLKGEIMEQRRSVLFPILFFVGINLLILSLSRLGLSLWQSERVSAVDGWLPLFLQGIRIDIPHFVGYSAFPHYLPHFS